MYLFQPLDNHILQSDTSRQFHGRIRQLPFDKATATTSSPPHHQEPHSDSFAQPPPPSRSSHNVVNSSFRLPRRSAFSKGINVNRLQPPPSRRRMSQNTRASSPQSSQCRIGVQAAASLHTPPQSPPFAPGSERSLEDVATATSQLRKLCMDIVQSAKDKEGTSPPPPPKS